MFKWSVMGSKSDGGWLRMAPWFQRKTLQSARQNLAAFSFFDECSIVSCLVATSLVQVIQTPADPQVRHLSGRRRSGWKPGKRDTPTIEIPLPEDFGTPGYWLRRGELIQARTRVTEASALS